jgi:hypothetical protein
VPDFVECSLQFAGPGPARVSLPRARRPFGNRRPGPSLQGHDTPPKPFYLLRSKELYRFLTPSAPCLPILVVLDLNKTLVLRKKSNAGPRARPYLSTFLRYLFQPAPSATHGDGGEQRLRPLSVMVWTSTQSQNAERMGNIIGVLPLAPLEAFWTRDKLGLNRRDYHRDVESIKDLDKIWDDRVLGASKKTEGVRRECGIGVWIILSWSTTS